MKIEPVSADVTWIAPISETQMKTFADDKTTRCGRALSDEAAARVVEIDLAGRLGGPQVSSVADDDRRRHRRFAVHPMYSSIRAVREDGEVVDGHLRDISVEGANFESMIPLRTDESLRFEIELPGRPITLRGRGRTVRVEREHELLVDVVVALRFDGLEGGFDETTLARFLEQGSLGRPA